MKDSFWLILLVGVAAGLPPAPSTAAFGTGTVRADPWVVRFGLEGQRQSYDPRFEFQTVTRRRLRGGGDDEPSFPEDEATLSTSGAGEGGFVERLKGSLARLMCMMPQERDGRSSPSTSAASAESEEDEREHIRFAAVAAEAVWLSREAVALAAAARKANEASIAKAEAAQARAHKQAADNALAMLRQEHEEAMVKQREEHAAELERMLGEQREVYEARVNELQKEREELKALGDYSPEAPRLFGVGMRLEVRDDGGYYIKNLVEGGGAYKSGLVMEGDKVVAVEGNSVERRTYSCVAGWTLGREGTSVRITLSRGGGEPFEVPIERCRFGPEDGAQVKREVDREHELLQHLVASKDVLLVEKCLADIAALELRHKVQRADAQLGLLKSRSLSPSGRDRPFSPSTSSLLASPTPPIQTSPSPPPVRGSGSEEPAPEPMGGSEEPAPEPMVENH